jgi:hypothetical protein
MTKKTAERVAIDQKALDALQSEDFNLWYLPDAMVAYRLKIDYIYVWRARHECNIMPKLLWAMVNAGYLDRAEVAAVLTVEVPPCVECGEAHTTKTCIYNRKSKPRTRFWNDVPQELHDWLTAEARALEQTNGEFLETLKDSYVLNWVRRHGWVSLADAASKETK